MNFFVRLSSIPLLLGRSLYRKGAISITSKLLISYRRAPGIGWVPYFHVLTLSILSKSFGFALLGGFDFGDFAKVVFLRFCGMIVITESIQ